MSSPSEHDKSKKGSETRLGKYRVLRKLGRGGMGVVYAAEDTLLKRPVAIKVLSSTVANNPDALRRFLREAQAAARLVDPHVVAIHEIGQHNGLWFIAMEMVAGGSLEDDLAKDGSISWLDATRWIADACRGLVAAHRSGLIHRDIKPANLLRTQDGQVKLADFGLAKMSEEASALTASGTVLGTPYFMSPEQWRNEPLDDLSDIYSLGATYYALLTRQPPYVRRGPLQVMYACCSEPPPDPRETNAGVPDACAAIVLKAMAKDPSERYADAQAMLDDLRTVSGEPAAMSVAVSSSSATTTESETIGGAVTRETAASPRADDAFRPSRWTLLAVLVVAAATIATFAWRLWGNGDPKRAGPNAPGSQSPSASENGWTSLFNGQNLDGWWKLKSPPGEWVVEDGILIGRVRTATSDPSSYLLTKRNDYSNFECRAEVRINESANSGIFFRCNSDSSLPQGLEAHLGSGQMGAFHRTWAHSEQPQSVTTQPITLPPNTWVTLEITARGPHIIIRVDGQTTADVTEHRAAPTRGYLALQVFEVGTEVSVRKIEIRELP